ncbi:MAG: hypothetical protein GY820_38810 [Gammaproteobacteria bacterium]|nr:hypothetical protein [Gammaproteobacteria bacterium]
MGDIARITDFTGIWTNADTEDIPANALTELENLIPRNGKMVKTYAFGSKVATAANDLTYINLVTYFHQQLSSGAGSGSGTGYVYILVAIDAGTNVITLYYWTGSAWAAVGSGLSQNALPTVYHKNALNPIIQKNEILRILPGNVGEADGTNESKGLWLGYIDRDFFWGHYATPTDYTAGFYAYDTELDVPDVAALDITGVLYAATPGFGGSTVNRYYRFTYMYDGINESLLSDELHMEITANKIVQINFYFPKATHNKRITALNVYRSEVGYFGEGSGNLGSSFYKIAAVDLTESVPLGDQDDGAYSGLRMAYIPDVTGSYVAGHEGHWYLQIDSTYYAISDPTTLGSGQITFVATEDLPSEWNTNNWGLHYDAAEDGKPPDTQISTGTSGCYCGDDVVIMPGQDFHIDSLDGAIITVDNDPTLARYIDNAYTAAVKVTAAYTTFSDKAWFILRPHEPYLFIDGTTVRCIVFDKVLIDGAAYGLLNSPSIKVNGNFVVEHLGKFWKYNVVLDPGGVNEVHDDWLMDSELEQYDVCPVSNVTRIASREGGGGTGMALSYNALVLFKKNSIFKLDIVDVTDRTTWVLREAPFGRGNVAPEGLLQVGNTIYYCSYDGIYTLDPNFEASADATPLIQNRISEPINDIYLALADSDKESIKSTYDQERTEAIFSLNGTEYAFNIVTKMWRKIETGVTLSLLGYDESGYALVYDSADRKLHGVNASESTGCKFTTKTFRIRSGASKGLVRYVRIRYKSGVALVFNLYTDGGSSAAFTRTLAVSASETEKLIAVRRWCSTFKITVEDSTDNTAVTEIYEMRVS